MSTRIELVKGLTDDVQSKESWPESWHNNVDKTVKTIIRLLDDLQTCSEEAQKIKEKAIDPVTGWITRIIDDVLVPVVEACCSLLFLGYVNNTVHKSKMIMLQDRLSNEIVPKLLTSIDMFGKEIKAFTQNKGELGSWKESAALKKYFTSILYQMDRATDNLDEADGILKERVVDTHKCDIAITYPGFFWRFGVCAATWIGAAVVPIVVIPAAIVTGLAVYKSGNISQNVDVSNLIQDAHKRKNAQSNIRLRLKDIKRQVQLLEIAIP